MKKVCYIMCGSDSETPGTEQHHNTSAECIVGIIKEQHSDSDRDYFLPVTHLVVDDTAAHWL